MSNLSQALRRANRLLQCDDCGREYTVQMLPIHRCPARPPDVTPAQVVAAARGWLGTRWQHQASLRGVACDCAGLVIGVARELGLVAVTPPAYDRRPDGVMLQALCDLHLARIALPTLQPGDVLLFRYETAPQHLAIVGDGPGYPTMIHAHAPSRKVVEHRLDDAWRARIVAAYRLPGLA
jgi:NlpC/P60 family putative phage cell wall peptidase